jgi:hypothetical protein
MDIITRQQALAQGLTHYFTGKPCKEGHIAPRFAKCCKCVECGRKQSLEGVKRWYNKNPELARERARSRRIENGDAIRQRARIRNKTASARAKERARSARRRQSLDFRILNALRVRLCDAINGRNKSAKTQDLLGCSIEDLKKHLEASFEPGMTWENWQHDGWHIDHIRPCASFDLTDPKQQRQCFHYTNLQPLWATDNIRKGASINKCTGG